MTKENAPKDGAKTNDGAVRKEKPPYVYKHPKPLAVTGSLFMWEHVASFSSPKVVCELEHVCKDVAEHLKGSNTGTRVMQRYWNAQWARLSWDEELISSDKKLLLPSSLKRSEGKKNWKKMYAEELPFWVQKTLQGVGVNNNATNEAKVMFKVEQKNAHLTGEQLAAMELTEEETLAKAALKKGLVVHVDENGGGASGGGGDSPKKNGRGRGGRGGRGRGRGRGPRAAGPKDPSAGYQRDDYKEDFRIGSRQGKHKKGGVSKWAGFADDGVYE